MHAGEVVVVTALWGGGGPDACSSCLCACFYRCHCRRRGPVPLLDTVIVYICTRPYTVAASCGLVHACTAASTRAPCSTAVCVCACVCAFVRAFTLLAAWMHHHHHHCYRQVHGGQPLAVPPGAWRPRACCACACRGR